MCDAEPGIAHETPSTPPAEPDRYQSQKDKGNKRDVDNQHQIGEGKIKPLKGRHDSRRVMQYFQEGLAGLLEPFFQSPGAIAIRASPAFGPIFVAAMLPAVRVAHAQ